MSWETVETVLHRWAELPIHSCLMPCVDAVACPWSALRGEPDARHVDPYEIECG